jgi:hypothetical protein
MSGWLIATSRDRRTEKIVVLRAVPRWLLIKPNCDCWVPSAVAGACTRLPRPLNAGAKTRRVREPCPRRRLQITGTSHTGCDPYRTLTFSSATEAEGALAEAEARLMAEERRIVELRRALALTSAE